MLRRPIKLSKPPLPFPPSPFLRPTPIAPYYTQYEPLTLLVQMSPCTPRRGAEMARC